MLFSSAYFPESYYLYCVSPFEQIKKKQVLRNKEDPPRCCLDYDIVMRVIAKT